METINQIKDKEISELLEDIDQDLTTTKDDLLDTLWEIQRVQVKQTQELHKYLGNLKDLEDKMTKLRGELKVRGV